MEKVKKAVGIAVSWFGVFWFVIFTLVSFPSFGTVIFLIGLTICLPIQTTRNFWNQREPHGAGKIALIVALIIAGAAMSPRKVTETPSNASEVVEAEESAPEINTAHSQTEAETENALESLLESEQTPEVAEPESVSESDSEPAPQPIEETPEPVIEPVEEPAKSKIDPTTMRGHGWSDQGREEPQYEGVEGFAVISSEYSSHLRWDDNFVNTPWPVDIYEKSGTRYEKTGTINHKTPIMVLTQDLKHERYGRYSGYLLVQRLDDGSQFYIDVNCFVTKAYWNGSVYDAALGGECIAEYHQKSEYPPTSNGRTDGERVEIADGKKVLITGTTGTSGKGPDRYTYPIEAVVFQNWKYGYGGVTIHFNFEDLTVVY